MPDLKPHLSLLEAYLTHIKEFDGTNAKFSHTMIDWLRFLNSERGRFKAPALPQPAAHKIAAFEAERTAHHHAMHLGDGSAPASIDHWSNQQRETLSRIAHNEGSRAQALGVPKSNGSGALAPTTKRSGSSSTAPLAQALAVPNSSNDSGALAPSAKRSGSGNISRAKKHKTTRDTLLAHITHTFNCRNKNADTILPSGSSLETIMFEHAKDNIDSESLVHSWVLDLEAQWVEELANTDRAFLHNLWISKRSSVALLGDPTMAWMENDADLRDADLRKCYKYLAEAEEVPGDSDIAGHEVPDEDEANRTVETSNLHPEVTARDLFAVCQMAFGGVVTVRRYPDSSAGMVFSETSAADAAVVRFDGVEADQGVLQACKLGPTALQSKLADAATETEANTADAATETDPAPPAPQIIVELNWALNAPVAQSSDGRAAVNTVLFGGLFVTDVVVPSGTARKARTDKMVRVAYAVFAANDALLELQGVLTPCIFCVNAQTTSVNRAVWMTVRGTNVGSLRRATLTPGWDQVCDSDEPAVAHEIFDDTSSFL
ncbi:hypothetical protein HDU86_001169 [Geranomyces michiganensis]|nr:hypothetical protein HDU86_001169 [Geranomyces michiganensis]